MAPSALQEEVDLQPVQLQNTKQSKLNGYTNGSSNEKFTVLPEEHEKHDLVLRVFRCLIADLCEQFNGGHPG